MAAAGALAARKASRQGSDATHGWCIQGFITGVAAVIAVAVFAGTGVPAGAYLGAAGPALLIGCDQAGYRPGWPGTGSEEERRPGD